LMLRTETAATVDGPALPRVPHSRPQREETTASVAEDEAAHATEKTPAPESAVEAETMMREDAQSTAPVAPVAVEGTLQDFLDRAAALRIKKAIEFAKGNRNAAATALGIDRTTLYRLMRRLGL
jgi:DNA-binding NtrC family response regulator